VENQEMNKYILTPYQYKKISNSVLITNSCGEHLFLSIEEFEKLKKDPEQCLLRTINLLKSRFFIHETYSEKYFADIFNIKYRTKHSYLENETLLLMVVPTIFCNCSCVYCQVNSRKSNNRENDMSFRTVIKFCDFVFALPHKSIKIEFQGGEPSLRFDIVELIVRRIQHRNKKVNKNIDFVVCTNLLSFSKQEIKLLKKYNVGISTSFDGPPKIHDLNRPSTEFPSSCSVMLRNVNYARKNGIYPSALVTVTKHSLNHLREIIDVYSENKFESIFLRPLNNYGCAFQNEQIYYSMTDYIKYYKDALSYLIDKNITENINLREEMFSIILRKISSPFNDGFVDMQNPCALGQMCMMVKQNGDIYPSDESRMISEMGNEYWKMGNVNDTNCFNTIRMKRTEILEKGKLENYEECSDCVYSVYCYADPIKKWYIRTIAGSRYESYCGIRKDLFDFVFEQLKDESEEKQLLFRRWTNA
jgi:uncharacterized protein